MFASVGHRQDPESLLRHLLAGCLLVGAVECAGFGWLVWLLLEVLVKTVLVLLGLLFPGPPEIVSLVEPPDMIEVVLEEPPELTEDDIPEWSPARHLDDDEPVPLDRMIATMPTRRAVDRQIAENAGILGAMMSAHSLDDGGFQDLWVSEDDYGGFDIAGALVGEGQDGGGASTFAVRGARLGGRGSAGLGGGGTAAGLGDGGTAAGLGGLGTRGRVRASVDAAPRSVQLERTEARPVRQVDPKYPKEARRLGLEAVTCRWRVRVGLDGRAAGLTMLDCPEPFRDAVERAVERCRWEPATEAGVPVESTVESVYAFAP